MTNPVGLLIAGATDDFSRPADTTVYAAGDRVSATTSDSGTTPLRKLFTARRTGGRGIITKLVLQTDKDTFLDQIRIHFFTVAAPATVIPGDNAAMGQVFANRSQYLGFLDFAALAEPVAAGVSDLTQAILESQNFGFTCAKGDGGIYYALQTLGTGTPNSAQNFHLRAEIQE